VPGTQQYLFGRAYAVALKAPDASLAAQFGNIVAGQSALRLSFEVVKTATDTPNTAKITLYNLNPAARSAVGAGYNVELRAGYDGLCEKVFIGVVSKATTARQGPDVTTTIEATDGQEGLLNARFNREYPANTQLASVLADIGEAMSCDPGVVLGLPQQAFTRGVTLSGSARDALKTLLARHGLEASIQNGKLNIVPKGAHLGTAAIVISAYTGMIGIPSATKDSVTFDSLLNPKLVPKQLVAVQSRNRFSSGFYAIRKAKLEGDTHDAKWQVNCECARLPAATQALSPAQGFLYQSAVVPGLL
jgi:hypothetical protein